MKTTLGRRNLLIQFLTLALIAIAFTAYTPLILAQEPRIYLDPSTPTFPQDTPIGTKFNVTAWVENATMDLGGVQITLTFDDSIINATRWFTVEEGDGGFMPSPITALPEPPNTGYIHVGPGEGYIKVSVSKGGLPPSEPWGDDGKICILEFNITAVPDDGPLTCALQIDSQYTYLLDPTAEEISGVTKEDGTYTIIPEFPPATALIILVAFTALVLLLRKRIITRCQSI